MTLCNNSYITEAYCPYINNRTVLILQYLAKLNYHPLNMSKSVNDDADIIGFSDLTLKDA